MEQGSLKAFSVKNYRIGSTDTDMYQIISEDDKRTIPIQHEESDYDPIGQDFGKCNSNGIMIFITKQLDTFLFYTTRSIM